MHYIRKLSTLLVAALVLAACASSRANDQTGAAPEEVRVTVRNDAFWDANIYLLRGGARQRLGMVSGHSEHTFRLPRLALAGLAEVRFAVDWIGRRDGATSESIVAEPGDEIELVIR